MELIRQKNKGYKKVRGVGINDAPEDYVVVRFEYIEGKRVKVWECPLYSSWTNMLTRCTTEEGKYSYEYNKKHNETYLGVSCSPVWYSFWEFRSWAINQRYEGNHLDKDLLGDGTYYSPDTCCYIPSEINTNIRFNSKGGLPLGVVKLNNKFRSSVSYRGNTIYSKLFNSVEGPHAHWKKWKSHFLREMGEEYFSKGVIDGRVYKGIMDKVNIIEYSLENDITLFKV